MRAHVYKYVQTAGEGSPSKRHKSLSSGAATSDELCAQTQPQLLSTLQLIDKTISELHALKERHLSELCRRSGSTAERAHAPDVTLPLSSGKRPPWMNDTAASSAVERVPTDFAAYATTTGYPDQTTPRPGQLEAIEWVRANRDVIAVIKCGDGKSRIYEMPAMHPATRGFTLVLTPLRLLVQTQCNALNAMHGAGTAQHCLSADELLVDDLNDKFAANSEMGGANDAEPAAHSSTSEGAVLCGAEDDAYEDGTIEARMTRDDESDGNGPQLKRLRIVLMTPEQVCAQCACVRTCT